MFISKQVTEVSYPLPEEMDTEGFLQGQDGNFPGG